MVLDGKVAVITGAGRGIGKAIALAYGENGADICCIARNESELNETVLSLHRIGAKATSIVCDVTNYQELKNAFLSVEKEFGGIDIVVINAGIDCENKPIEELDENVWENIITVNLSGPFYTAKAAIPYLKKRGGGKIITLGSGLGHKGRAEKAPYSCSKAGLWMLTRILAQELIDYNISVNELIPGPVDTHMKLDCDSDKKSAFSINGEWIKTPGDVKSIALFLASQPLIGPTAQSFSLMRRDL